MAWNQGRMPQGDSILNDLQRRSGIEFYLMIDLSARQIGMLREGGAGDRWPRRSGRVIFRVVLIVMGMMVFVILVRFPR